ncbi:MAG: DUF1513 domain-containing protein [Chromatiaceae bacterium]|nr:DUF1513 domain-containing protein [Gammaproteobacteria bacterium]MCP5301309.1 DUF1513 domain-containing protein [Chromatiaceae bacterium]MCP5421925.1 DUF1513 domain-containing protein [Chromatiaceae bacterium]
MATDRRTFLRVAATAMLLGPVRVIGADRTLRLLGCRSDAHSRHYATLFDSDGTTLLDVRLPARGHGFAVAPDHAGAVVFARRPGAFMQAFDLRHVRAFDPIDAARGRHFYGHGVYSADGALLFATENAFDSGTGRIGVYDVHNGYARIGEFDSHGVGPHEIRLMADGATLAVANGGIRTHPDRPRAKLNLDTMRASLAYVDSGSGALCERVETPTAWQRLSIRHIDVNAAGDVALAMQYEGPKTARPPLVALHRRGEPMRWLQAPEDVQQRLRNYCGSVTFARDGQTFAVSSPRGGLVMRWARDGHYLGELAQRDVCGIAASDDAMWYSDGSGVVRHVTSTADDAHRWPDTRWDNHLTAI